MAWTTPLTQTDNAIWTSAQWNLHVRDNLLETMAGKATTAGNWFVSTGANAIAERTISQATVATSQTTTSTSYTNLTTTGPQITVTTGTAALVFWYAKCSNSTSNASCSVSVAVTGATTSAAADTRRMLVDGSGTSPIRSGSCAKITLTAGSNTFTMQYKVSAGTGTFVDREMLVMAM